MKRTITGLIFTLLLLPKISYADDITFYTWRAQDLKVWEVINENNYIPGVNVKAQAITRDAYIKFVELELLNGNADLFLWKPGPQNLKTLIDKRWVAPYKNDLSMINQSALSAAMGHDGNYYGVPFSIQLQSIMVNKKLLDKYNQAQPNSLPELTSLFERLKADGITPMTIAGGSGWYVSQVVSEVLMAGLVDEKFAQKLAVGKACFNDSEYKKIFDILTDWKSKGYLNDDLAKGDYGVMSKSVALGNSAMSIDGGWMAAPTSVFFIVDDTYKFDFWSIPGKSNKIYSLGDGSFQVGTTSKNRQAAEKVLEFTTTKKFAELFAEHVNELPAYGKPFYIKEGELKQMAELVASRTYNGNMFTAYELNRGTPNYNQLVVEALQGVMSGKMDSNSAANHIQQGLNSWKYIGSKLCQ